MGVYVQRQLRPLSQSLCRHRSLFSIPSVSGAAHVTRITVTLTMAASDTRVRCYVHSQRGARRVTLFTPRSGAHVRLLARVHALVLVQRREPRKPPVTDRTAQTLLARVHDRVVAEVGAVRERLAARRVHAQEVAKSLRSWCTLALSSGWRLDGSSGRCRCWRRRREHQRRHLRHQPTIERRGTQVPASSRQRRQLQRRRWLLLLVIRHPVGWRRGSSSVRTAAEAVPRVESGREPPRMRAATTSVDPVRGQRWRGRRWRHSAQHRCGGHRHGRERVRGGTRRQQRRLAHVQRT